MKVATDDALAAQELVSLNTSKASSQSSFGRYTAAADAEAETYAQALAQIEGSSMKELLIALTEHQKAFNEKKRVYLHFMNEQTSEYLDTFRAELLQHLAGSLVIKEHRLRYQKEQYDRFLISSQDSGLKKTNQTLKDFSVKYALLIEALIEDSHNERCPKVEANYDDFSERKVRPINATIFYFFFGLDRTRRTWAQWLLSAARYPNDRVRRAYMRFFA